MELFALHCTTCKARLKVTDESVIGQILSCPKCESMVLIEPPPGWKRDEVGPAVIAPAPAQSGFSSLSSSGSSFSIKAPVGTAPTKPSPVTPAKPTAMTPAKAPVTKVPSVPAPPPLPVATSKPLPVAMTDAPQPVAAIAASVTSDPSVAVASSAGIVSRLTEFVKSHDYRVLAGGIAGGIAVGTLLFVLLMSGGSEETPPTVAQAPVSVAIEDRQVEETEPRADVAAAATSEEQINEPAVTEVRSLKPVAEVAAEVSKEILEENVVAEQPVEIPDDPLDNANEVAAEVNDAAALAAEPAIVGPVDPATTNKESPAEEFTHLAPSTTGPRPSPLLSKLDRRVYKLAFDKMPLRQFAAFISEYGDVPITIDAASLEAAKIESPLVSIKQSDPSTLAEVMKKTLAGLRLSYEARDGAIVIFAPLPTT